jgi:glycosyltransferase involved in cell wall biosynthesis
MQILPRRAKERLIHPYVELNRKLDVIWDAVNDTREKLDRVMGVLRHIHDEDPANRRRLYALRASDEYELAFTESEPLVTFVVATFDNYEGLRDVALPSILNQSYSNIEVIVSGDAAPPETGKVVADLGDPRVRFINRTVRGPYPDDDEKRWFVLGTPPFNDGASQALGRWIAHMSDDDAIRPGHTQALLEAAQEHRFEHCYGRQLVHFTDGDTIELGVFPPAHAQFGTQASIYHSGLRFFESELADAMFEVPNDWSLCERMLRAGVRFGMVDEIVFDKYEHRRNAADWAVGRVPEVD